MKLTGAESLRQLEILHYLATAGWIDGYTIKRKFATIRVVPLMRQLIHMGHPIVERKRATSAMKGDLEWWWDPEGIHR